MHLVQILNQTRSLLLTNFYLYFETDEVFNNNKYHRYYNFANP